jgi:hypothetical protein
MNRYDQFDATNVASLNPNTNTFPTLSSIAICPPKAIQTGTARNPTSNLGIMIRCTAPTFNDLPPSFTLTTTPTGGVI